MAAQTALNYWARERAEHAAAERRSQLRHDDSLLALPHTWPRFRSPELGAAEASLTTICLGDGEGPPRRLYFTLSLSPATASILEPIREESSTDRTLRVQAEETQAGISIEDQLGPNSRKARQEEVAFRKARQRMLEDMLDAGPRFDTVLTVFLIDSTGYRTSEFPVFRRAVKMQSSSGQTLIARDSTTILCSLPFEWRNWRLERIRRRAVG